MKNNFKRFMLLVVCIITCVFLLCMVVACNGDEEAAEQQVEISDQEHQHVMIKSVVRPTCLQEGYDLYACNACDYSYKENYVHKVGHYFEGSNCIYCNIDISDCADKRFDISIGQDNSILEYLVRRSDGGYDAILIGSGEMLNENELTSHLLNNQYSSTIKRLWIDENITTIGNYIFYYCNELTSVSI